MVNGHTSGVIRQLVRVFQDGTLAGLSDGEVLGRFVDDRDEAAFEALLSRHGPMVLNVCRQILRDRDDAEDAFQATFLALACKASSLRVGESLGPWLYRVASRVAARARADRRRRGERERSGGPIPEPEPARDDRSGREEIPRVVHEELGRLPERLRAPIVLCYLEGMTHEQAANQLRCPVGTVRSRMARARALLHGRIARRGLITTTPTLDALLATDAGASAVPPHLFMSLVKTAAQLAAGTASLHGEGGVPARVVALLEGVLNVLRIKRIAGSMATLAVIGAVVAFAGLSIFPASGQTDDDDGRIPAKGAPALSKAVPKPTPQTIVKTYYIGDLIIPLAPAKPVGTVRQVGGARRWADVDPVIDLITSTVARGTWTVNYDQTGVMSSDGKTVALASNVPTSGTVGVIQPIFLKISLIIRHTPEVHEDLANLLRKMRRLIESRENPGGGEEYDPAHEALGITPPAGAPKPAEPASPHDRKTRIRRLLDELREEVESLPKGSD